MHIVSITRFRARSLLRLPAFAWHAARAIFQLRGADGYLGGAVKRDADRAFWTMTVWRDEAAMRAYLRSGAHGAAMPRLRDLAVEASMVRWSTETANLPDWEEAVQRMRTSGHAAPLSHPGPNHADLSYPEAAQSFARRL